MPPEQETSKRFREPERSDAYVLSGRDGNPVGMAIYVGERLMLTCAHVVAAALNKPEVGTHDVAPAEGVFLRFFRTTNATIPARVRADGWFKVLGDREATDAQDGGGRSDIAVLELDEEPDEHIAVAAVFTDAPPSRWEGALRFFGKTKSKPAGGWVTATENGSVEKERLELRTAKVEDNIVQAGCSGSLVWDEIHGRCVGMVDARRGKNSAYMIPTDCLVDACCEIHPELPENRSLAIQVENSVMFIDRTKERKVMEESLRDIRGQNPYVPAVCTICGHNKTNPELLLKAFIHSSFRRELRQDQRYVELQHLHLSEGSTSSAELKRELADLICFDSPSAEPKHIAEQLRARKETLVLATELYVDAFDDGMRRALTEYIAFLQEISANRPNVLFFQFFIVTTDSNDLRQEDAAPLLEAIRAAAGASAKPLRLYGPVCFGPLERVRKRHLRDWVTRELKAVLGRDENFNEDSLIANVNDRFGEEFDMNDCVLFFSRPIEKVLGHA